MDPATAGAVGQGAQGVGGMLNALVNFRNVRSQAASADYNATSSRQQADQALRVSSAEQVEQNRQARQIAGTQRAATAQSGTGDRGSNKDILDQTSTLSHLDQLNLAYDGMVKRQGFLSQTEMDAFQRNEMKRAAPLVLIGGALTSAGHAAAGYSDYSRRTAGAETPRRSVLGSGIRPGAGSPGLRVGGW